MHNVLVALYSKKDVSLTKSYLKNEEGILTFKLLTKIGSERLDQW